MRPVAIVTGAGSGIGAAIAVRLAGHYDLIVGHLKNDTALREVSMQAERRGATVWIVPGDLTDVSTTDELARAVANHADRLEILVSNAGAYPRNPWETLGVDAFRRQVEVNLITHMVCAKMVTPSLTARGDGRIIAISSVLTQLGRVDVAAYIAAKSGLEGLIRALARELGPHGITVNCIRAGSIEVAAERSVVADHQTMLPRQLDRQCIKRRGRPADIAAAVEFLASAEASFITGQSITIDGGWCLT